MADCSLTDEPLFPARLASLPADIARPGYDRDAVRTGILHLGPGAFHRAHQVAFTEDCLAAGETAWGILGASLRSAGTRDALAPQDFLYTLALREGGREALRVVGALRGILAGADAPRAVLAALDDPAIRIVTLTITERGYGCDVARGELDEGDADVAHDLAAPDAVPRSVPGLLAASLWRRRRAGIAPFTLLSCDNLAGNGRVLHAAVTRMAARRDRGFGDFVAAEVACPSSMVDRIVPATTAEDRARIAARLGCADAAPVVGEPFAEWVIEDRFPTGRPGWERAGARFVTDVAPHERRKLRLLNGAHTMLATIGPALGCATVAEAVAHERLSPVLARFWAEMAATLPAETDAAAYCARLRARFGNTALRHELAQIALGSAQKLPQRILLPCLERWRAGRASPVLIAVIAAWLRGAAAGGDPLDGLARREVFAADEWRAPPLRGMIAEECGAMARQGLAARLDALCRAPD